METNTKTHGTNMHVDLTEVDPGEWVAAILLDYPDGPMAGERLGELTTYRCSTACQAIGEITQLAIFLGYQGRLYFEGEQGEDYGSTDLGQTPPVYRKPWQLDAAELAR